MTVTGVDDNETDGDQAYAIVLTDNASTDGRYKYVDPPDVSLKNLDLDGDKGGFYVSLISRDTDESLRPATFTVRLDSQPTDNVTINAVSSDTSEGMASPSHDIFTPLNWNAEQTVTVTGVDDNLTDGDQSYAILLSDNTSTDTRYQYVDPPDVTLKNLDLDGNKGGFYASAISRDTDESGRTATFAVRLSSQPTDNVTIDVVKIGRAAGRESV